MNNRTDRPAASTVDPFLPGQEIHEHAAGSGNTREHTTSPPGQPQRASQPGEAARRKEGGKRGRNDRRSDAGPQQQSGQRQKGTPGRPSGAGAKRGSDARSGPQPKPKPQRVAGTGVGGSPSGQVTAGQAKRVIGYRRISKDNGSGLGLAAQTAAIKDQAKRLGALVVVIHTDRGVSGAAPIRKRLGLLAALGDLRSGDVLVIARRDRLARDVMVAGWIEKEVMRRGAAIVSASGEANGDGPYDKIMRTIINAFAELERDLVVARNRAVVEVQRARGLKLGHCPYGYRGQPDIDDRGKPITRLVKDEAEQKIIKRVKRLRAGGASLRAISAKLAKDGQLNRQGRPFGAPSISRLL